MIYSFRNIPMIIFFCLVLRSTAAPIDPVDFVDPFIGTDEYLGVSQWGKYGGTFPGAVVPFGRVQLSPETSVTSEPRGYLYSDSTICFFSALDHMSGYPSGSAGRFKFLPVNLSIGSAGSAFSHHQEKAIPGYYRVQLFSGIDCEFTTTERTGFTRFNFSAPDQTGILFFDLDTLQQTQTHLSGRIDETFFILELNVPVHIRKKNSNWFADLICLVIASRRF